MEPLGKEDQTLDALWRGLYGQPLPVTGAAEAALKIILGTMRPPCLQNPSRALHLEAVAL